MQRIPTRPMKARITKKSTQPPAPAPAPVLPLSRSPSSSPPPPPRNPITPRERIISHQELMEVEETLKYSDESDDEGDGDGPPDHNNDSNDENENDKDSEDVEMDDIYGDLDLESIVFQRSDVKTTQSKTKAELETRVLELEEVIVKLNKNHELVKTTLRKVKTENENLTRNINDLLETAKSEIFKKNFMLSNLQKKFTEVISKTRNSHLLTKQDVQESTKLLQASVEEANRKPDITEETLKEAINQVKSKIQVTDIEKRAGNWTRTLKFGNCSFFHFSTEQIPFMRIEDVVTPVPVPNKNVDTCKPMISKPQDDRKTDPEQDRRDYKKRNSNRSDYDDRGKISSKNHSSSRDRDSGERSRSRSSPRNENDIREYGTGAGTSNGGSGYRDGRRNNNGGHHHDHGHIRENYRIPKYNSNPREREGLDKQKEYYSKLRDRRSEDLRKDLDKDKTRDRRTRNENPPVRSSPRKRQRPNDESSRR